MLWIPFRWFPYRLHPTEDPLLPCKPPLIHLQPWALQVSAQPMSRTAIIPIYSKRIMHNSNITTWCPQTTLTTQGTCNTWAIRASLCSRRIRTLMAMCPGLAISTQKTTTASYSKYHQRHGQQWWWIWQLIRVQSSLARWCLGRLRRWAWQTSSWKK
jgi:hypothetical protein